MFNVHVYIVYFHCRWLRWNTDATKARPKWQVQLWILKFFQYTYITISDLDLFFSICAWLTHVSDWSSGKYSHVRDNQRILPFNIEYQDLEPRQIVTLWFTGLRMIKSVVRQFWKKLDFSSINYKHGLLDNRGWATTVCGHWAKKRKL